MKFDTSIPSKEALSEFIKDTGHIDPMDAFILLYRPEDEKKAATWKHHLEMLINSHIEAQLRFNDDLVVLYQKSDILSDKEKARDNVLTRVYNKFVFIDGGATISYEDRKNAALHSILWATTHTGGWHAEGLINAAYHLLELASDIKVEQEALFGVAQADEAPMQANNEVHHGEA